MEWKEEGQTWQPKLSEEHPSCCFLHPVMQQRHFKTALDSTRQQYAALGRKIKVSVIEKIHQVVQNRKKNRIITCSYELPADPLQLARQVFSTVLADFPKKENPMESEAWVCRVFAIFNVEVAACIGHPKENKIILLVGSLELVEKYKSYLPLPVYKYCSDRGGLHIDAIGAHQILDTVALIPVHGASDNDLKFGEPEIRADFTNVHFRYKAWRFYCMIPGRFSYPPKADFDMAALDIKPNKIRATFVGRDYLEGFQKTMGLTTALKADIEMLPSVAGSEADGLEEDEDEHDMGLAMEEDENEEDTGLALYMPHEDDAK